MFYILVSNLFLVIELQANVVTSPTNPYHPSCTPNPLAPYAVRLAIMQQKGYSILLNVAADYLIS